MTKSSTHRFQSYTCIVAFYLIIIGCVHLCSQSEPPENCHLNVKKIAKNIDILKKNFPKIWL